MSIRDTSITAYNELKLETKSGTQKAIVLNYIKENGSKTRRQLAKALMIETSTISARVNSLINEFRLLKDDKTVVCPISKKRVHLVELMNG